MPTPSSAGSLDRSPHLVKEFGSDADRLLAHLCLTYAPGKIPAPESTHATDLNTAAALGDVAVAERELARDPEAATRLGGPFEWEPLLYLAYARVAGGDHTRVAEMLLAAGADPDSGYLWDGLPSPFTALTGAFGGGERDEPAHPAEHELARLLLEAGADPNDSQTLYNRQFRENDSHLELLFEYGLGTGDGGRWHARVGAGHHTPEAMLHDVLLWAAANGQRRRVELMLAHGVDPRVDLPGHPVHRGLGPVELAVRGGHHDVAALLRG
ncbi:hypothetical protein [Actinokineospora enzanensis]|uniref:hypothetical protein n=1 Tax=Actinokineospora enzanensis TaxID=155975 RepID=UPI0003A1B565|nr:hypothetical protein [Actinokineospora enzanensis]